MPFCWFCHEAAHLVCLVPIFGSSQEKCKKPGIVARSYARPTGIQEVAGWSATFFRRGWSFLQPFSPYC